MLIDPPESMTHSGSIGPGKLFIKIAMPERNLEDNVEIAFRLTFNYFNAVTAKLEFVDNLLKNTEFTESIIRYDEGEIP